MNKSSPRITNNVFEHNPCRGINLHLPAGSVPHVENNTVVDNTGGIYLARYTTSLPTVKNNIVVGNDIGVEDYGSSTDPTWQYNDVYGNGTNYLGIDDPTGTQGNISADPLFQGASTDDWSLQPTSPAIDTGGVVKGLIADFLGNPRPVDDGNGTAEFDMGAFEFQPSQALTSVRERHQPMP